MINASRSENEILSLGLFTMMHEGQAITAATHHCSVYKHPLNAVHLRIPCVQRKIGIKHCYPKYEDAPKVVINTETHLQFSMEVLNITVN